MDSFEYEDDCFWITSDKIIWRHTPIEYKIKDVYIYRAI